MGAKIKPFKNKHNWEEDYVKASKRGEREAKKEIFGNGFKAETKIHNSQKAYSRKGKNKFNHFIDDINDDY